MKTLIPCATLYSVEFPDGCDLADCLSKAPFTEPSALDMATSGFVAVPGTDEFVFNLPGVAQNLAALFGFGDGGQDDSDGTPVEGE